MENNSDTDLRQDAAARQTEETAPEQTLTQANMPENNQPLQQEEAQKNAAQNEVAAEPIVQESDVQGADAQEEPAAKEDFKNIVENLLFVTDRPLSLAKISQTAEINDVRLTRDFIGQLQQEYAQTGRAVQIIEIGGGFQMATKPEYGRWVRKLFNEKMTLRLSPAALETLAIIAYKQPVTRAEIESIRGVDIVGPLEKIMERGLVKIVGKKDTPGRPLVYGTTEEFLRLFGLNKLSELPEIKTFSGKGIKEVQNDLPFSEALPDIKDKILPLEEGDEDEYLFNRQQEIFTKTPQENSDAEQTETAETQNVSAEGEQTAQTNEQPKETAAENVSADAFAEDEAAEKKEEVIPGGMQVENLKDLNS